MPTCPLGSSQRFVRSVIPSTTSGLSSLAIRDLAMVLKSDVCLAQMPPLGGWLEPIRRIVTRIEEVGRGDVWWGSEAPLAEHASLACQAWVQGAAGVVSAARRLTPWPGTFALSVPDPAAALETLARHVRGRFAGNLVAVGERAGSDFGRLLATALAPGGFLRAPLASLAELATMPLDEPQAVVSWKLFQNLPQPALLRLSRPHVAVISSRPSNEQERQAALALLEQLPERWLAVLPDDWHLGKRAAEHAAARIATFSPTAGANCPKSAACAVALILGVSPAAIEVARRRLEREKSRETKAA